MASYDTSITTRDPNDTSVWDVEYVPAEDPYAGLNRAQRRKAMAVEGRAFRKRNKKAKS